MKRVYALILTVLLVCLGVCTAQAAARMEDGFCFDVENGGAVVISYAFDNENPKKSLVIPKELGGYPVRAIGYSAFDGCWWLEDVTLPDTLRKISQYAFSGCYNLTDVNIPYGVTLIGKGAFMNCCNMESVILPDSLVQLEGHAFQYCSNLKEITIPAGVERVTNYTFGGCYGIKKINVKGRDTQFYRWAFCSDGDIEGFEQALDTDRVIFTCWPGQTKTSRAYSPEMYAVKTGIRNIRYHQEDVPPPAVAPAPPSTEEIPEQIVEIGYPVVIVPELNSSKGEYKNGDAYDPQEDGLYIRRVPIDRVDSSGNTYTVEYDMVPCDAHGNELKFWTGDAYILFFYKDFIINGEPLTQEKAMLCDFKVAHEYAPNQFEYFDVDDMIFEKHGFRVKISSLSPFAATVTPDVGGLKDAPNTGDQSAELAFLLAAFALSAAAAVLLCRRRA